MGGITVGTVHDIVSKGVPLLLQRLGHNMSNQQTSVFLPAP
jgi:hypothetical protein